MTGTYAKLASDIVTSSIWSEDDATRIVWITILALKDQDGFVSASVLGLANIARKTVEETLQAIAKLESPDPYSRSKEYDGRRIAAVDGGWLVLNHPKYRDKERVANRKEYLKEYMRTYMQNVRQKSNKGLTSVKPPVSVSVSVSSSGDRSAEERVSSGDPDWDRIEELRPPTGMTREGWIGLKKMYPKADHKRVLDEVIMAYLNQAVKSSFFGYLKRMMSVNEVEGQTVKGGRGKVKVTQVEFNRVVEECQEALRFAYHAEIHGSDDGAVGRCLVGLRDKFRDYRDAIKAATEFAVRRGWPDGRNLEKEVQSE